MKEEFVSYSQAVALKECGFGWECNRYYDLCGDLWSLDKPMGQSQSNTFSSAPTLALAQKWLRDEKGIDVVVEPVLRNNSRREYDWFVYDDCSGYCALRAPLPLSENYESALVAGLDAALELIKQK